MTTSQLLTIQELARHINCGERMIRDLVRRRQIPFVRLGYRTLRFDLDEVREAIGQLTVRPEGTMDSLVR